MNSTRRAFGTLAELYPERLAEMRVQWDEWNAQMLPYGPGTASEGTFGAYADRYWPPIESSGGVQ